MSRVNYSPEHIEDVPDPRRVALITGCSAGGIGYELAKALDATGRYRVFATARNVDKMRMLPNSIERVQLDVVNDESVKAAVEEIIQSAGRIGELFPWMITWRMTGLTQESDIDVLVNNAGLNSASGPVVEVALDKLKETFEANVFGLLRVTQAVSGHMIRQAKADRSSAGMIVNIGSTAGYNALPFSAAYSATKATVHVLTDAMRMELSPFGIRALVVAPGKIRSGFGDNAAGHIGRLGQDSHYAHVAKEIEARAQFSQRGRNMPTVAFASAVVAYMEKNGSLGAKAASPFNLLRFLPGGNYLTIGPMGTFSFILYYLPSFIRDRLLSRFFGLQKISQWKQYEQQQKQVKSARK